MVAMTDDELRKIYEATKTIAVVGASSDPSKPAQIIPRYLQYQGFRIIPVSPRGGELLGERVYSSLLEVPDEIDVVDVFRPAEEAPAIAHDAISRGAKVLWLQSGVYSEEAERIAAGGGLKVVMDACIGATHARLGLGPDPYAE